MVTVNLGMQGKDRGNDLPLTHHRLQVPQEETEAQRGCRARGREEQKARRRPEVLGAAECVPADQRCL